MVIPNLGAYLYGCTVFYCTVIDADNGSCAVYVVVNRKSKMSNAEELAILYSEILDDAFIDSE